MNLPLRKPPRIPRPQFSWPKNFRTEGIDYLIASAILATGLYLQFGLGITFIVLGGLNCLTSMIVLMRGRKG